MRYEKKKVPEANLDDQINNLYSKPKYEKPDNKARLGSIDALDMYNFDSIRDQDTYESKRKRSVQL